MAPPKKPVEVFQSDKVARTRLDFLKIVHGKRTEEQILAEALGLMWERDKELVETKIRSVTALGKAAKRA